MKKLILVVSLSAAFTLHGQTMLTQSSNQTIWAGDSAACTVSGTFTIQDNSFIRVFDINTFSIQDTAFFVYLQLGVESTSGGAYNLIGKVHKLQDTLLFANMTLLAV